jgi:phage FluMu gp28-like protein
VQVTALASSLAFLAPAANVDFPPDIVEKLQFCPKWVEKLPAE